MMALPSPTLVQRLRITVLMEHRSTSAELATEHGLSLWIEADGDRILFDTGQSRAFADNASKLGIDLRQIHSIVLSHGHYDHTGGLETALELAPDAQVFLHPEAITQRFSRQEDQSIRSIGMPASAWKALAPRYASAALTTGRMHIAKGIWVTGPIPRRGAPEHPQSAFARDEQGHDPDRFTDDQALVIEMNSGSFVITGCCHSGVLNTLDQVHHLTQGRPIFAMMGGLHLLRSDATQIQKVMDGLHHYGIQQIYPGHCTGPLAESHLCEGRNKEGRILIAGTTWEW